MAFLNGRKEQSKCAPFSGLAHHAYLPSMGYGNLASDGQTYTRTLYFPSHGCASANKFLENDFPLGSRDTMAPVVDADRDVSILSSPFHRYARGVG